jgi:signal transduction histidine kinase
VHGIIRQLRPSALDHLGLSDALHEAVAAFESRHPEIGVDLELGSGIEGLGEQINITVYRIVQECLTNVVRHAEATRATISVELQKGTEFAEALRVQVRDNGRGLEQRVAADTTRFGLMGMRERVQALGGHFDISGSPGEGALVDALIPIKQAAIAASVS